MWPMWTNDPRLSNASSCTDCSVLHDECRPSPYRIISHRHPLHVYYSTVKPMVTFTGRTRSIQKHPFQITRFPLAQRLHAHIVAERSDHVNYLPDFGAKSPRFGADSSLPLSQVKSKVTRRRSEQITGSVRTLIDLVPPLHKLRNGAEIY